MLLDVVSVLLDALSAPVDDVSVNGGSHDDAGAEKRRAPALRAQVSGTGP